MVQTCYYVFTLLGRGELIDLSQVLWLRTVSTNGSELCLWQDGYKAPKIAKLLTEEKR